MIATMIVMRGRPLSFDRDQALEQAVRLFWERGYDTTSVAELTEVMGITAPSLYTAFGDKRRLFLEAVDRYEGTYGAFAKRALSEEPTAHEAISRLLRDAARQYTHPGHPRGCLVITAATNCTATSEEIRGDLLRRRQTNLNALEKMFRRDLAAGLIAPRTNARDLALFYAATLQGMSQQARDGASRRDLLAITEISLQAWPNV